MGIALWWVLPNNVTIYVEDNPAGGRTYASDEVGRGVVVWDTSLVNESTLKAVLEWEQQLNQKKE